MICKYCGREMEWDYDDGVGFGEYSVYTCECSAFVVVDCFSEESWEEPSMSFGQAMELIKKGRKVLRHGWNGKGMVLQAQFPDENSKMTFPYLYITIPDCPEGVRKLPWQPAQVDIFSEDWELAE